MKIIIEVDEYSDINLSEDETQILKAKITNMTMSGTVSKNYQSWQSSISMDVDETMGFDKCAKFLRKQFPALEPSGPPASRSQRSRATR